MFRYELGDWIEKSDNLTQVNRIKPPQRPAVLKVGVIDRILSRNLI